MRARRWRTSAVASESEPGELARPLARMGRDRAQRRGSSPAPPAPPRDARRGAISRTVMKGTGGRPSAPGRCRGPRGRGGDTREILAVKVTRPARAGSVPEINAEGRRLCPRRCADEGHDLALPARRG